MPAVSHSILELIGNTPVVRLNRIAGPNAAEVWGKLESMNPSGSVKDRICLAMVESAERAGRLRPGDTLIEPTSGNTGLGLALVAAVKGYRLVLTMPDTMSEERRSLLTAYGATLILTEDTPGMQAAVRKAEALRTANPRAFMPQQFTNPANPDAHRRTTAAELLEQLPHIDAFVAGVGTGGTVTGVGGALRAALPDIKVYAVEPARSPVLSGHPAGQHHIQGLGAGFVPEVLDTAVYDAVLQVDDDEAAEYTRRLAREEGILAGISAGANVCAATRVAHEAGPGKVVVTIICDMGERYLTTGVFQGEGI